MALLFFWLNDYSLAMERVNFRVAEGGHNIPSDVIKRRYVNGLKNLFELYLPIVDEAMIFDNSNGKYELIAEKRENGFYLSDKSKFTELKLSYAKNK